MGRLMDENPIRFRTNGEPDVEMKRTLVRAYMNIRQPITVPPELLTVQDKYLRSRKDERGIVHSDDIPTIDESLDSDGRNADVISLWQGDITELDCDAKPFSCHRCD